MRVIIAGSRTLGRAELAWTMLGLHPWPWAASLSLIVCGCADGIDKAGWLWARKHGVPVEFFPAWERQWAWAKQQAREGEGEVVHGHFGAAGRSAGYRRNEAMSEAAEGLVAVWDGVSRGTQQMVSVARMRGLEVYVQTIKS